MKKTATSQQLQALAKELNNEQPLPNRKNTEQLQISCSHVFREREKLLGFAKNIMLDDDESLIAGHARDSVGDLWWLGVHIADLERWRAKGGFHHIAMQDPEVPENSML